MVLLNCPLNQQDHWVSFQLVDEFGDGTPYANLNYTLGYVELGIYKEHKGTLDKQGYSGKIANINTNAALLYFDEKYNLGKKDEWYDFLVNTRAEYKLPITQLQYVAEQTRRNPSTTLAKLQTKVVDEHCPKKYYGILDIHHFVEKIFHLPEWTTQHTRNCEADMVRLSARSGVPKFGKGLEVGFHHVIYVRALRAYRPLLSTEKEFSALNAYQLALFATASYRDFEEKNTLHRNGWYSAKNPLAKGYTVGCLGYIFNEWANYRKVFQFGKANTEPKPMMTQSQDWIPVIEDVPYSKRFEVVPFSEEDYPNINKIDSEEKGKENPAKIHFFEKKAEGALSWLDWDTQAYAIHSDEFIILSPRGTNEMPTDIFTDLKALQVPFAEGVGKAHRGFYESFKLTQELFTRYLGRFFVVGRHKVIVTGHSLGGAMATLTAEWIRRTSALKVPNEDLRLYTYASPRAGDETFVKGASELTHYRLVSHVDPIPLLPFPKMSVSWPGIIASTAVMPVNPAIGFVGFSASFFHIGGDDFVHHGKMYHFTTINASATPLTQTCVTHNNKVIICPTYSSQDIVMWHVEGNEQVSVRGVEKEVGQKALAVVGGLPVENCEWYHSFGGLATKMNNHYMLDSYIPATWSTLKRWIQASDNSTGAMLQTEYNYYERVLFIRQKELDEYTEKTRDYKIPQNVNIEQKWGEKQDIDKRNKLRAEVQQLAINTIRAKLITDQPISKEMVYGKDVLQHPEFEKIFNQWTEDDKQRIKRVDNNYKNMSY